MSFMKTFAISKEKICSLLLLLQFASFKTSLSLELPESIKPISVQNGSDSGVVIDCPYELGNNETSLLEIKWFYSSKMKQVYQWLPENQGRDPQALNLLKGRLDLSFEVSQDKNKKHRALAIVHPTSELTGKYTCRVSNYWSDKSMEVILTVYIPPMDFYVNYEKPNRDAVTVSCTAEGVFPEPELHIFRLMPHSKTYKQIKSSITSKEFESENGTYSKSLQSQIAHSELEEENEFLCSLSINNTDYQIERQISYYPAGAGKQHLSIPTMISSMGALLSTASYYSRL